MRQFIRYVVIVIMLCLITISLSLLAALILNYFFDSELSSWIQAVGTICAIVTGFAATIWQINQQQGKTTERGQTVYTLTEIAADRVCNRLNNARRDQMNRNYDDQKKTTTDAIKRIENIVEPPIKLQESFYEIRTKLTHINTRIDTFWNSDGNKKLDPAIDLLIETKQWWDEFNFAAEGYGIKQKCFPANKSKYDQLCNVVNSTDSVCESE